MADCTKLISVISASDIMNIAILSCFYYPVVCANVTNYNHGTINGGFNRRSSNSLCLTVGFCLEGNKQPVAPFTNMA